MFLVLFPPERVKEKHKNVWQVFHCGYEIPLDKGKQTPKTNIPMGNSEVCESLLLFDIFTAYKTLSMGHFLRKRWGQSKRSSRQRTPSPGAGRRAAETVSQRADTCSLQSRGTSNNTVFAKRGSQGPPGATVRRGRSACPGHSLVPPLGA